MRRKPGKVTRHAPRPRPAHRGAPWRSLWGEVRVSRRDQVRRAGSFTPRVGHSSAWFRGRAARHVELRASGLRPRQSRRHGGPWDGERAHRAPRERAWRVPFGFSRRPDHSDPVSVSYERMFALPLMSGVCQPASSPLSWITGQPSSSRRHFGSERTLLADGAMESELRTQWVSGPFGFSTTCCEWCRESRAAANVRPCAGRPEVGRLLRRGQQLPIRARKRFKETLSEHYRPELGEPFRTVGLCSTGAA